jgi:flagellar biogenesis protein FliO
MLWTGTIPQGAHASDTGRGRARAAAMAMILLLVSRTAAQTSAAAPLSRETAPIGSLPVAASPVPAAAPTVIPENTEPRGGLTNLLDPNRNELVRVGGALAVVLGLLILLRLAVRRWGSAWLGGARRPSGVIEILARYPVARGQQLIVVKLVRRILLVHHGGNSMTTLAEVVDNDEVAALLTRIEAATGRRNEGFSEALAESDRTYARPPGGARPRRREAILPPGRGEVVDLTRRGARAAAPIKPGRLRP